MSVVIHEVAHGQMANILGDKTAKLAGRLTLNPLKHLDWLGSIAVPLLMIISGGPVFGWAKPVPYNPNNLRDQRLGRGLVSAAGPLSNIIIAIIFSLAIRFGLPAGLLSPSLIHIFAIIVVINLFLALFNLLPIPPLDGSGILFSILSRRTTSLERFLSRYQIFIVLFIIFFGAQYLIPAGDFFFRFLTGLSL